MECLSTAEPLHLACVFACHCTGPCANMQPNAWCPRSESETCSAASLWMQARPCHRNECRKRAVQALTCCSPILLDHWPTGAIIGATRDRHRKFSNLRYLAPDQAAIFSGLLVLTGKSISSQLSELGVLLESTGIRATENPDLQLQAGAAAPLGTCIAALRDLPREAALSLAAELWPKRHEPPAGRPCQHFLVQQHS